MKYKILDFTIKGDERGSLIALEQLKDIPFEIKRIYYIFDTLQGVVRGKHAHKNLKQVLISVKGACKVLLDDGNNLIEFNLNRPDMGLLIEGLIWREMYDFTEDCVLLVLADDYYRAEDYINNYKDFKVISNG